MLNRLIRWSLENRWLVLILALGIVAGAGVHLRHMPLDVFPELNAPTVTVMTEAPGFAAEEVERAVTFPLESALNGLPGVRRVRSSSATSLSIVWAEFDFGEDIHRARQLIGEKLAQAREALPENVHPPEMTPVTSITGEVMLLALTATDGGASPLELRRVAEFELRTRLLAIGGVAQVTALGGALPEFQVHVRPDDLLRHGLSLDDVAAAAAAAHAPVGGGYLADVGGRELPISPLTRAETVDDIASTVVGEWRGTPVTLARVADVREGGAPRRGTGSANGREAVILTVQKNPGVNTLALTEAIDRALDEFERSMPAGTRLDRHVFRQADFVQVAVRNVLHALRDGVIFVVLILVLFLLNFRTTFITLTALPLSIGAALLILHAWGASINVMTLGGLGVAIGSLVDDAIVDVENVFRRLRQNAALPAAERRPALQVVYDASVEVRSAILVATSIIVLVFAPLFLLSGVEGRLFQPLGASYVISLAASLVVAVTVTPVLCYWLLGRAKAVESGRDGWLVRVLKRGYARGLAFALRRKPVVVAGALAAVAGSLLLVSTFGSSFLPEFNEGSITLFLNTPAGTSLVESDRITGHVETQVARLPGVASVTRRTGRAENDEHAEPVSASELDVRLRPGARVEEVHRALVRLFDATPGLTAQIGGPIAHRLSHILSGTPAAVAIKLFGDDLATLRTMAKDCERALAGVPGVRDLVANREIRAAHLPIAFDRDALARHGLTPADAARQVETAFLGRHVGVIHRGGARSDVVLRLGDAWRDEPSDVEAFLLRAPSGAMLRLATVAEVREDVTSSLITRENVKRKAVVSCNVAEGHNLGDLVAEIRRRVDPIVAAHPGTFVEYGGQFEAQAEASHRILLSSLAVLVLVVGVLFASLRAVRPVLLCLVNLPLALVGGVAAVFVADSPSVLGNAVALFRGGYVAPVLSIASLVGFIGLAGIAIRNGLLLIDHYYHLMEREGVPKDVAVVQGSLERLVPILMTAISSALALVPLVLAKGEIGSELQHPLAVVMLGGLVSSTVLNLFVVPVGFALFGGGPRAAVTDPVVVARP
ncbi:MAG: efflux RND transporter permease subunit [Planctomycetia bacterium]|nr:efflux RND transporter permease subunit [Planctomycetia bacterium]